MSIMKESVGWKGRNQRNDVLLVQQLLNRHVSPPMALVVEDGLSGPKTIAAIKGFQRKVVRMPVPDGRVDPSRGTIAKLTGQPGTSRGGPVAAPVPGGSASPTERYKADMQRAFNDKQKSALWQDYWNLVAKDATPEVKRFFSMIGRAEDARKIANFYLKLFEMGASPREIKQVLQLVAGCRDIRWTKNFVEFLAEPAGSAGTVLNKIAKAGKIVGFVAFVIEYIDHWSKGDYHMAIVEVYKSFMGGAIPWAGYIDTLQSFVNAVLPKSVKQETSFKIIKAVDPIGLGAQGVDFMSVVVTMSIEGKFDEKRLHRLAKRMKTGSTAFFYDMGDDLAEALCAMADMDDTEFDEMMRARNIWTWLNDFWLTKYSPSLVLYRFVRDLV